MPTVIPVTKHVLTKVIFTILPWFSRKPIGNKMVEKQRVFVRKAKERLALRGSKTLLSSVVELKWSHFLSSIFLSPSFLTIGSHGIWGEGRNEISFGEQKRCP